jgi:SAM-dependent methyltransferase
MAKEFGQMDFFENCELLQELGAFDEFGQKTACETLNFGGEALPVFVNEFWTSKQRAGHPLHEISYRACFKPQLPRFFIDRLTKPGDVVYDPFMGRGTTLLEAALLGRHVVGCDISPLSERLIRPRLELPEMTEVEQRLKLLDFDSITEAGSDVAAFEVSEDDLLTFYHPETLRQIQALRSYLHEREQSGEIDAVDRWIRMVAINRLTGHSTGFFSVYTMPPNQAVSAKSQRRINERRKQTPPERDVKSIISKKSRSLMRNGSDAERVALHAAGEGAKYLARSCDATPEIEANSVDLVVTSPPFLDVVDYQGDNWLRGWFNHVDTRSVPIWQSSKAKDWVTKMHSVFAELSRVLKPGASIAFEVGEVRGGMVKMETMVLEAAAGLGLVPEFLLINSQEFTKTANCWGVVNGAKGTNTNRVIVLRKT